MGLGSRAARPSPKPRLSEVGDEGFDRPSQNIKTIVSHNHKTLTGLKFRVVRNLTFLARVASELRSEETRSVTACSQPAHNLDLGLGSFDP